MEDKKMIAALEALGWDFVQYAPEEWEWKKFNEATGECIARQGDATWAYDIGHLTR